MQIRNPWMPKTEEVFLGALGTLWSPPVNPGFPFLHGVVSALQVMGSNGREVKIQVWKMMKSWGIYCLHNTKQIFLLEQEI